VLQLEDLFPEAAVAAGYLRNPRIITFFSKMAEFQYRRATHITLIAEAFRQNLLARNVPVSKMTWIPVWADPDFVRPLPKNNAFRTRQRLEGKFVVLYAGNLGATSCLEDVLQAAARLQPEEKEICFVLIGEGLRKNELLAATRQHNLQNVRFLPFQPRETFPEVLAAADVNLVTLNVASAQSSLPSKVFNGMASGRPVLAITPPESELTRLVTSARCGVALPPGQPRALAEQILFLKEHPEVCAEMGRCGRAQLESRYARRQCVDRYEAMLCTQVAKNQPLLSV
jgi:colanic acid biosynthesis glycosyl transferase WcaI